jgi:hypothetical protein
MCQTLHYGQGTDTTVSPQPTEGNRELWWPSVVNAEQGYCSRTTVEQSRP